MGQIAWPPHYEFTLFTECEDKCRRWGLAKGTCYLIHGSRNKWKYPYISMRRDTTPRLLGESQRIGILHSVLSIRYRGLFYCKLKRLGCNANHLRPSVRKVKEERRFVLIRMVSFTVGCIGPTFVSILLWGRLERDIVSVTGVYFVL